LRCVVVAQQNSSGRVCRRFETRETRYSHVIAIVYGYKDNRIGSKIESIDRGKDQPIIFNDRKIVTILTDRERTGFRPSLAQAIPAQRNSGRSSLKTGVADEFTGFLRL